MRFAAVGFTCIDVYKNLNISYPTGNGIDLMFNLMDLVPELVPSVVTAIGDDAYGQSMLEACQKRKVDTGHVTIVPGGQTAVIEMLLNGRDRVHHRAEKGVMIPYQPTGDGYGFYPDTGLHSYRSFVECDRIAEGHEKQGNEDLF